MKTFRDRLIFAFLWGCVLLGCYLSVGEASSFDIINFLPDVEGYSVIEKNEKYGLANSQHIPIINPIWDSIITFDDGIVYTNYGYCIVEDNENFYIYSLLENRIIDTIGYSIVDGIVHDDSLYFVMYRWHAEEGIYSNYHIDNSEIFILRADDQQTILQTLGLVCDVDDASNLIFINYLDEKGHFYFNGYDFDGKVIWDKQPYSWTSRFRYGYIVINDEYSNWNVYSENGNLLHHQRGGTIGSPCKSGYIPFSKESGSGYMTPDGIAIVSPIYKKCYYCGKESCLVSNGTQYLVIDYQSGNVIFSRDVEEATLLYITFLEEERYIVVYNECGRILVYDILDNLSYTVLEWVNKDETLMLFNNNFVNHFTSVYKYWDNIYFGYGQNGWQFYNINGDEMQKAKISYEEGYICMNGHLYSVDTSYNVLQKLKRMQDELMCN